MGQNIKISEVTLNYPRFNIRIKCPDVNLIKKHLNFIIEELYQRGEYDYYNFKNMFVVDVGAYLGETAIYFARNGAKHVYCYEPFYSFNYIKPNANANSVGKKVSCFRIPITGKRRRIHINKNYLNFGGSNLTDGQKIPNYSVNSKTLSEIGIKDSLLKMDCEGSEHEIFSNTSKSSIRKFCMIIIEVHNYYWDIQDKLVKSGFKIDKLKRSITGEKRWMIYAQRIVEV